MKTKYTLTDLIKSLNTEEIRNFNLYINRTTLKEGKKKTLQLFELIKEHKWDEYDEELVIHLFGKKNKNAFYRLKNRLIEEIEHSLLLLHRAKDERFKISKYISLAQLFIYKSQFVTAYNYLLKAEKLALSFEYPDIINIIYDQIITISTKHKAIDVQVYIEKRKENNIKYEQIQQLNTVTAIINRELLRTNFSGKNTALVNQLTKIITQLQFTETYINSPQIQFQIHKCVREVLLQKKDFVTLENYLFASLKTFEEENFFTKETHQKKIVLLSWLINAFIKNKKLAATLQYTEHLHKALLEYNKLYYDKYIWTYYQSLLIGYSFSGKNETVIKVLTKLQAQKPLANVRYYEIFIFLNLAVSYYCLEDIVNAQKYISKINATDIFNQLPANWQINVLIVELILSIEMTDYNYVSYKINNTKRMFKKEFATPLYQRENEFISILHSIAQIPLPYEQPRIIKKINAFINSSPKFEPGSNEAINYQVWLMAKLQKKKYYPLILEKVKQ